MSIDVGDGSSLVLGVRGEPPEPETDVRADGDLVFQHKQPGVEQTLVRLDDGRFNSHFPVMVHGRPHVVFAGEVDSCVDAVLLRLSEPNQPPYHEYLAWAAEVLGRRVWMSHPQPLRRNMRVWVAWLHGQPEHIPLFRVGGSYGPPSSA